MGYVGNTPAKNFHDVPSVERFNGDASTTAFTMGRNIGNIQDVLVSVDGVVQDTSSYSVNGTQIVFSAAPSSGTGNIFINVLGVTDGSTTPPAANKGNFKAGGLFRTNAQSLTADITILATENANATGPLTVASSVTLTVESGGTLVVL